MSRRCRPADWSGSPQTSSVPKTLTAASNRLIAYPTRRDEFSNICNSSWLTGGVTYSGGTSSRPGLLNRVRQGPQGNSLAPVVVAGQDRPMGAEVLWTDDPRRALETTGRFLAGDPVRHNLILTLLHRGVAHPEPARYWTVLLDGQPAGFVFQSPLDFVATLTPMPDEAVAAVVHSIVDAGVVLPGVNGEAAVAARFAGQWTGSNRSSA